MDVLAWNRAAAALYTDFAAIPAGGSGQRLMVLTAEPGGASHDALRILASWTAGARDPRTATTAERTQPLTQCSEREFPQLAA